MMRETCAHPGECDEVGNVCTFADCPFSDRRSDLRMTTTHTTSGGGFYETAVELRSMARTARENYPAALARIDSDEDQKDADVLHAPMLIVQAVGFEIAAALLCVAQAIEDHETRP